MAGGAFIPGVKTSAFVGPAGTGKSQRAQLVASLVNADFIIARAASSAARARNPSATR